MHRFHCELEKLLGLRQLTSERFEQCKTFLMTDYCSPRTGKALVESTVAGTITKWKAVFNWAKKQKWISTSPLEGVSRGSFISPEREEEYDVTMDDYYLILLACPCLEWRVIVALARIGGLRCPSELFRLRWSDVDW